MLATIDRTQLTGGFLESLLGPLPRDSCLEVRRKHNSDQGIRQEFYDSIQGLYPSRYSRDEHCWFGVCLRRRGTRTGRATDLTWAPVVWADFDNVEDKAALVEQLLRLRIPPTHIVDSGGGIHAYWRLTHPMNVRDEEQAMWVREVVHGLAIELGADPTVHDLPRVLRLPGTFNSKHKPAREVTVLHTDAGRRVSMEQLEEFRRPIVPHSTTPVTLPVSAPPIPVDQLRVSDRWKKLIRSGWLKGSGYPSRSELDHAVMVALLRAGHTPSEITAVFQDPANGVGEKYREKEADGPRYLAITLASAREYIAQGSKLKLEDGVMKAYRVHRNAYQTIYSKPIIPLARLRGATDAWHVRVAGEPPIILDSEALASAHALKRALPPVGAWTGTDQDAQLLIPYFESHAVPEKTSVGTIGVHGDRVVFPNAVLGPAGLETDPTLVYTGSYRAATLRLVEDWAELARAIGRILLGLHEPGPIYAIAGWFLATFVAPQIRELASQGFPLLNVYGNTGSGKTTLLSLLWRMTGSTRLPISIRGSTDFSRTMNLSSSTTLPMVLDEHRTGPGLAQFYAALREAYTAEEHERGRADLTVVRLPLTSPVAVAGESALPDPALRHRALMVRLSHEMLGPATPPSLRRQAKAEFEALPLEDFNGGFYQDIRSKDVRALWREESARVGRLMQLGADDRQRFAFITALVGLRLFEDFLPGYDPDAAAAAMARMSDDEEEPSLLRLLILTVFKLLQQRELRIDQDLKIEKDRIFFNPTTVLFKVSAYLRREDRDLPTSEDALREALRAEYQEHDGQGIVHSMRTGKWLGGTSSKVIELNLKAVEQAYGIDRKQWEAIHDATLLFRE